MGIEPWILCMRGWARQEHHACPPGVSDSPCLCLAPTSLITTLGEDWNVLLEADAIIARICGSQNICQAGIVKYKMLIQKFYWLYF